MEGGAQRRYGPKVSELGIQPRNLGSQLLPHKEITLQDLTSLLFLGSIEFCLLKCQGNESCLVGYSVLICYLNPVNSSIHPIIDFLSLWQTFCHI